MRCSYSALTLYLRKLNDLTTAINHKRYLTSLGIKFTQISWNYCMTTTTTCWDHDLVQPAIIIELYM